MYNVESTIGSQYANSPAIDALIASMNTWMDPTPNLQQFYSFVWNILTAQGFGLDIWGSILGVGRTLQIPATTTYFGFNGGPGVPFNNGAPFYAGESPTQAYQLPDSQYLSLLLAKAFANISATTIPAMNQMLQLLFGDSGVAYVVDVGNMILTLYFEFNPTPVQYAIVANTDVLPHPTGVYVNIQTPLDVPILDENGNDILDQFGLPVLQG
jgi:hypothetical protein